MSSQSRMDGVPLRNLCYVGMGSNIHRHAAFSHCLDLPLLRASGKDKTMKTPIEFDYDLWTTEDGKCMVRVKSTGEVTEIDREIMRFLRAEEKRVRRSMTGIPIPGCKDAEETSTLLSLDYVSYEGGEDMSPAWLEDPSSLEESILTGMIEAEFVKTLTVYQRDVYEKCMRDGMSLTEYSRSRGVAVTSIRDTKRLIQKKAKKFFE